MTSASYSRLSNQLEDDAHPENTPPSSPATYEDLSTTTRELEDESADNAGEHVKLLQAEAGEFKREARVEIRSRRRLWGLVGLLILFGLGLGVAIAIGVREVRSRQATARFRASHVQKPDSTSFILAGAALAEEAPTTRQFTFVVEERLGSPDGFEKPMLVVNGQYPGPTIEANVGDRIVVIVFNKMSVPTAIHWHGMYQRETPFYDGTSGVTQCGIPPGESLTYNFTLGGWSGTTWWHAHHLSQYTDGISGAFIIQSPEEKVPAYHGDVVIQMSDLYHRVSSDLVAQYLSPYGMTGEGDVGIHQLNEPVPDTGTINGIGQWGSDAPSYFYHSLDSFRTYRFRLINTGSLAAIRFSVDSHVLTIVEADGTSVVPYNVTGLEVAVAQRYSVLLTTRENGAFWMRASLVEEAFTYSQPGFVGSILGVLRYGVSDNAMPDAAFAAVRPGSRSSLLLGDLDSSLLVPMDILDPPAPTIHYTLTTSIQKTAQRQWLSFINSTSWEPLYSSPTMFSGLGADNRGAKTYYDTQFIITVPEVEVVELIVNNYDDGDHPFHLHGHKFWIMGTGQGKYQGQSLQMSNPMRRDTVVLKAYTWTVLRFVADNPGVWSFHCHVSWHMASGLLMQWLTLPGELAKVHPPREMLDQCKGSTRLKL